MKGRGIVALVIVGLWALTQAIIAFAYPASLLAYYLDSPVSGPVLALTVLAALVPAVALAMLGAFLISRRGELAQRWFADAAPASALDLVGLLRLGLIVVGVSLLVRAIPDLLATFATLFVDWAEDSVFSAAGERFWVEIPQLLLGGTQLALGFWLVARSGGLAARLWSPRRVPEAQAPVVAHCSACGAPFGPDDYRGGQFTARCESCGESLDVDRT